MDFRRFDTIAWIAVWAIIVALLIHSLQPVKLQPGAFDETPTSR